MHLVGAHQSRSEGIENTWEKAKGSDGGDPHCPTLPRGQGGEFWKGVLWVRFRAERGRAVLEARAEPPRAWVTCEELQDEGG